MALVTLAQAKEHLRITGTDHDADVQQKMTAAEAAILSYINTTEYWRGQTATWTDETTVPPDVQHAMLIKIAELDRFRGDDAPDAGPALEPAADMSPAVTSLLRRWRDPVLA
jgi:hypothetical protein